MRLWRALIGTYGAGWVALAVVLPLVLGTALAGLGYYFWPTSDLEVPRVVGHTQSAAESRVGDDFEIRVSGRAESSKPEGHIFSQYPAPGTQVDRGSMISVVLSRGQGDSTSNDADDEGTLSSNAASNREPAAPPEQVIVPFMTGQSVTEARGTLKGAGLTVGKVAPLTAYNALPDDENLMRVVRTEPGEGTTVDRSTSVTLRVVSILER